jgi:hypothetical protein
MSFNMDDLIKAEARSTKDDIREWTGKIGGEEVTLYSSTLSPKDTGAIDKRFPGFMQGANAEAMVAMLIRKCRDAHGKPVFKQHHQEIMVAWGLAKIGDIYGTLFGDSFEEIALDDEGYEARVGNSKATGSN